MRTLLSIFPFMHFKKESFSFQNLMKKYSEETLTNTTKRITNGGGDDHMPVTWQKYSYRDESYSFF